MRQDSALQDIGFGMHGQKVAAEFCDAFNAALNRRAWVARMWSTAESGSDVCKTNDGPWVSLRFTQATGCRLPAAQHDGAIGARRAAYTAEVGVMISSAIASTTTCTAATTAGEGASPSSVEPSSMP